MIMSKVEKFHKNRRMFCIKNNQLQIAEPNLPYSHAEWFEKENWTGNFIRGYVDNKDIFFYIGDFVITEEDEKTFFNHLRELVEKLGMKDYKITKLKTKFRIDKK